MVTFRLGSKNEVEPRKYHSKVRKKRRACYAEWLVHRTRKRRKNARSWGHKNKILRIVLRKLGGESYHSGGKQRNGQKQNFWGGRPLGCGWSRGGITTRNGKKGLADRRGKTLPLGLLRARRESIGGTHQRGRLTICRGSNDLKNEPKKFL